MAQPTSKLPELKKQIKENNISGLYLFYGDEIYVKNTYLKRL